MKNRLLVAAIFIPIIFAIFYLIPPIGLTIAIVVLSAIGVHEVLVGARFAYNLRMLGYGMIFAAVVPLWFHVGGSAFVGFFGIFALIGLCFAEALYSGGKCSVNQITGTVFFSLFIPITLSSFVRLRSHEPWQLMIILPILIAFTSDAGGLFAGMLFGKHKLAPEISPKKTVEGAIGAVITAAVCSVLLGFVAQFFGDYHVHYGYLLIYGIIGSVISQFGDLCFSYIKREHQIKDYGKLLPGHGGVLDRFDSVIFCAPLCELLIVFLPAFSVIG